MSGKSQRKGQGLAFFLFMWSILSTPLGVGLHVVAALLHFRIHPFFGAAFVLLSGLGYKTFFMDRKHGKGNEGAITYFLLCAPLIVILTVFALKKNDSFLFIPAGIFLLMGVLMAVRAVLPRSGREGFDRLLDSLIVRIKIVSFQGVVLFIPYSIARVFSSWPPLPLFFGFMGAWGACALAAFLLPRALAERWSARLPGVSFKISGGSSGGGSSRDSRGGGASGGAGAGGSW
jgi:hypothetical protein